MNYFFKKGKYITNSTFIKNLPDYLIGSVSVNNRDADDRTSRILFNKK